MLDHISLQCADLAASGAFYDRVLAVLGHRRMFDEGGAFGYGTDFPVLWIGPQQTGTGFRELHIAFAAADRASVDAFFAAATEAGAEVLYPPAVHPEYHPS